MRIDGEKLRTGAMLRIGATLRIGEGEKLRDMEGLTRVRDGFTRGSAWTRLGVLARGALDQLERGAVTQGDDAAGLVRTASRGTELR
jgi:hypothetical protein